MIQQLPELNGAFSEQWSAFPPEAPPLAGLKRSILKGPTAVTPALHSSGVDLTKRWGMKAMNKYGSFPLFPNLLGRAAMHGGIRLGIARQSAEGIPDVVRFPVLLVIKE